MSKSTIHLIVDSGPKQGETLDRKTGSLIRIGRVVRGNTLAIKDPSISQKHLIIKFDTQISRWTLRDLESANGTFVNGDRVPSSASVNLRDGDAIKIGECTSISVKISVVEENAEGIKRNGEKRGRGRSKKADDRDQNCERVLTKEEVLDLIVEHRGEEVRDELKHRRKQISNRDLSKDEILCSALDDWTEAENLGRGRRTSSSRLWNEDKILGMAVENMIEVPKNFHISEKANDVEEIKHGNCKIVGTKDEKLDAIVDDGAKDVPINLRRGRKRKSTRGSKKSESLESALNGHSEVLQNLDRVEGINSSGVLNKNGISEKVVEDRMKVQETLGRGRRGKAAKVSQTDRVVEDNTSAPKNLGRGRRTNSAQILEKDPSLDLVEERAEQSENLRENSEGNSSSALMHDKNLNTVTEGFIEAPKNLRRGRRPYLVPFSKKDEVLKDNIEVPKTRGGGRRTRFTKVSEKDGILDLVAEEKTLVPKNVRRGRRTSSTRVPKFDGTLDSVLEDRTEAPNNVRRGRRTSSTRVPKFDQSLNSVLEDRTKVPKNLVRGKRRANSFKVSKVNEIFDAVVEDAVEVEKNAGIGKPKGAQARRTRASSRISKDELILQPAQSNFKNVVLNPVENLYQSKELREGSHQLSQSGNTQHMRLVWSSPADSTDQRSQNRKEKENYVSFKCQQKESETTTMRNSCDKRNTDGETHKSSHVLPKVWNGNGIPNTTTKYKEDSKVCWHATPFEERLEKALSGDKLCPSKEAY